MNKTKFKKDSIYKWPVIHSITLNGIKDNLIYTNDNTKGHFDVEKVVLSNNENQYPYNDFKKEYGMSEITFGIPITSKQEGDYIINAINSPEFKEIIKATKWGAFQTDYRMFKYFKKDFWKEFDYKTKHSTFNDKKTKKKTYSPTGAKYSALNLKKKKTRKSN